jgi:hypothetical protein
MGAVMHSIWTGYWMRVMEPELWSEENIAKVKANGWPASIKGVEEYLSEKEAIGGEDKSFREHVRQHIEKWSGIDDPYWNFDKRIHDWINKVFESRIPVKND